MRTALALLILLLATTLNCSAKDLSDWAEVQKLKTGTEVLVVDTSGNRVDGYVTSVSQNELRVNAMAGNQPGLLSPAVFARAVVGEVYKVGKKYDRRLGAKNLILASGVGLLGGIAIGAAVDQAHPSIEDPGQGKLVGGILGFFAGPAVLAGSRAILSALHRTKLIYKAQMSQRQRIEPDNFSDLCQHQPTLAVRTESGFAERAET